MVRLNQLYPFLFGLATVDPSTESTQMFRSSNPLMQRNRRVTGSKILQKPLVDFPDLKSDKFNRPSSARLLFLAAKQTK